MLVALTSDTHRGYSAKTGEIHDKFLEELAEAIEREGVQVLIHAGDWGFTQQKQFKKSMEQFRKYIKIPIITVRGNHDFWDRSKCRFRSMETLFELHKEWFKANDIHHLEEAPFILDGVYFDGWDGWYHNLNPWTYDVDHMTRFSGAGGNTMHYMTKRAEDGFYKVWNFDISEYKKKVCVTHFPPHSEVHQSAVYANLNANPHFFDLITEKFDVFCFGHTHQARDLYHNDCRVLNCGSGYDDPKFIIFEI